MRIAAPTTRDSGSSPPSATQGPAAPTGSVAGEATGRETRAGVSSVLCIGEAMVELALDPKTPGWARLGFAGDTLNTAIYLKRSAPQLRVGYATKLGRDEFSDRMVEFMEREAIDVSQTHRSDSRLPGLYAISTDSRGERTFAYWRDSSAARDLLRPPGLTLEALCKSDAAFLSAITLAILPPGDRDTLLAWLREFRRQGGQVAFDGNYRPRLWESRDSARAAIDAFWKETDIALPSLDDEIALFGPDGDAESGEESRNDEDRVVRRLREMVPGTGALKRGERGPRPLRGDGPADWPAETRVVDSTAAGDSFNAGYLGAIFAGSAETDALAAGHDLARRVLAHRGAIIPRNAWDSAGLEGLEELGGLEGQGGRDGPSAGDQA